MAASLANRVIRADDQDGPFAASPGADEYVVEHNGTTLGGTMNPDDVDHYRAAVDFSGYVSIDRTAGNAVSITPYPRSTVVRGRFLPRQAWPEPTGVVLQFRRPA